MTKQDTVIVEVETEDGYKALTTITKERYQWEKAFGKERFVKVQ